MIKIINLTKSFGSQTILEDASATFNQGEKNGLIGRNGHGKTTILKMIIGEEHPDNGEIIIPKDYVIGYVNQTISFSKSTVLEEGSIGLPQELKEEKWMVKKILFGLGFTEEDLSKDPLLFSGGYQVRLNLAKVLISDPDMLLLDEPTNYLDIVSIRWLKNFLIQWSKELLLVTHDRSFMDDIISHTIGIHRKKLRKISGNTGKLYNQITKEEEIHEKTRLNDEKKRKETELYISRFRSKARLAGMVQSRIKSLEKQEKLEKLDNLKNLNFFFSYKETPAKTAMSLQDISFSYDNIKELISHLSLSVSKNDRICIVGKNGKGKTTLLKIIANELNPKSGGMIFHPATEIGYYAQTNIINLNENFTIEEELMQAGADRQEARNIAGTMMFEGDAALKKIKILSGGEKSRVLLAKILVKKCNLLLLDEPTNHLDMESSDAFMNAINHFEGASIIVTHNEMFLHNLANRFIVFKENKIRVFEGNYNDFLNKIGWDDEQTSNQTNKKNRQDVVSKKDQRKLRAEILTEKSKTIAPLEKELSKTEAEIENIEKKLTELNEKMVTASLKNIGNEINELSKDIHSNQKQLETLYEKYDNLIETIDRKEKIFEERLATI